MKPCINSTRLLCERLAHLHVFICEPSFCGAGHALEAGWFLLQYGKARGAAELQDVAVQKFMEVPFLTGWDKQHGGLFYFLDADGHCPTQVQITTQYNAHSTY